MCPLETAPPDYMSSFYFEYQKRYALEPKEADKALLKLMIPRLAERVSDESITLLDIGCSNGNLLRHLKNVLPQVEYWGGDIQPEVIEKCKADPELDGIRFEVMDARDLSAFPKFNVIVANAVLSRFAPDDFAAICDSLYRATNRGGFLFALDYYHRFEQDLALVERSTWHPEGLTIHLRSFDSTRSFLSAVGYAEIAFFPFEIPIDLPIPTTNENISTYTRRTLDGDRLQFRGALYLPWCHLSAYKS